MYKFEPGVAYRFTPCIDGQKSFVAVAAERYEDRNGIEFVVPVDLIRGITMVMDGREFVKVNFGGQDYCASAAAPLDVSAAFDILEQIRNETLKRV